MQLPNYNLESELGEQGYQYIAGVDEAGRGAWAGPVVACAIIIYNFQFKIFKELENLNLKLNKNSKIKNLSIRDSKLLSESQREILFDFLKDRIVWSVGVVSHQEIDKLGIQQANLLAMYQAIDNLQIKADYILTDKIFGFQHQLPFQNIIDGDAKVLSIAAASIMAKVYRDRLMREADKKFPNYCFGKHKGYGTKLHQECLLRHGVCELHRVSYKPVGKLLVGRN